MKSNHENFAKWLRDDWPKSDNSVAYLEGMAGVGKSHLGRTLLRTWDGPAVWMEVPEQGQTIEDLLLEAATLFDEVGETTMSSRSDLDLVAGFRELTRSTNALLIVDRAQWLQDPVTQVPSSALVRLVKIMTTASRGRLLLITNHAPADGDWLDHCRQLVLPAPPTDDAVALLERLLNEMHRESEVPVGRRNDVVQWLGCNPRAIRALVGCLESEQLDSLIEIEPDAWELRDDIISPQLISRLETYFLSRTLDNLDGNASLMADFLSVYRKPFRRDAYDRLTRFVTDTQTAYGALASRHLIERHGAYSSLHPVIRRLARVRLQNNVRRETKAHQMAAEHFTRRLHNRGKARDLATVGDSFVEARFHLLTLNRQLEFEAIASEYRHGLRAQYQAGVKKPETESGRRQLLSTLQGALGDTDDGGYSQLRTTLAQLFLARGAQDDDRLALRQLTLASRETKEPLCWKLRLELTLKLEGRSAGHAVAKQALGVLHDSNTWSIVIGYAQWLAEQYSPSADLDALRWLKNESKWVAPVNSYGIYSLTAFILGRNFRGREAIGILITGHETLGENDANAWRLLEEAAFIAYSMRDSEGLSKVRTAALGKKWGNNIAQLCDVLILQSTGKWADAIRAAGDNTYKAISKQKAFAQLCEGDIRGSAKTALGESGTNRAEYWLKALIALCRGKGDVYMEEMSNAARIGFGEGEIDPTQWLKLWDYIPNRMEAYPAFYFPVLPPSLTGLDVELRRFAGGESIVPTINMHDIRLPVEVDESFACAIDCDSEDGGGPSVFSSVESRLKDPTTNLVSTGGVLNVSQYYVYGTNSGPVGNNPTSMDNVIKQGDTIYNQQGIGASQLGELASELSRLRDSMRETAESPEHDLAIAEVARAELAAENGDHEEVERALSKAGRWAWSRANDIGTSVAAHALKAALGL